MDVSKLVREFAGSGAKGLLDMVMCDYERAHLSGPEPAAVPLDIFLESIGDALEKFYRSSGDEMVLDAMFSIYQEVLKVRPEGHEGRPVVFFILGATLYQHCIQQRRDTTRLKEAIALLRNAVELYPPGGRGRLNALGILSVALISLFERSGDIDRLHEGIETYRVFLDVCPPEHPGRFAVLSGLANALLVSFKQNGDRSQLEEATALFRQALAHCPPERPERSALLRSLASVLVTQFEQFGDITSLEEAISLHRQALDVHPPGHPERLDTLRNLASVINTRFEQLNDLDSLAEVVDLRRQILDLRPLGDPDRPGSINNLAIGLRTRFEHVGDLSSLVEVVDLYRQALHLHPPGHPEHFTSLSNLAIALTLRFEHIGDSDLLAEAVDLHRKALYQCPLGHHDRSGSLNNLANALMIQFQQLGDWELSAEAVSLHRQALDLRPPAHPGRSTSLSNLATALHSRYDEFGDLDALREAVDLHRQALDLRALGHFDRSMSLNNLATTLQAWAERIGHVDSLSEAIGLHREALDLRPLGHVDRPSSLGNLATALHTRLVWLEDWSLLPEVIDLHREALNLRPPSHPRRLYCLANLGNALAARASDPSFERDVDEELALAREGLQSCAYGHPMRSPFLFLVANCMLDKGSGASDFAEGIRHILEGLRDTTSPARSRLRHAMTALRNLETFCQSTAEHALAMEHTRLDQHDMVLQVYVLTIRLLPRVASLGYDHTGRLRELSGVEALTRNAATRAVIMKREEEAVEMLEEGRGVFWAQALRLRGTELDILPPEDAQELKELFQVLEAGSERDQSLTPAQQEQEAEKRRLHSEVAEAIIADIRSRPGLSRFLLPPVFSSLVQALPEKGFVVILVASELGHHALLLSRAEGRAQSIEVIPPEDGFSSAAFRDALPRAGTPTFASPENVDASRFLGVSKKAASGRKPHEPLNVILGQLWKSIVKPVIGILNLKKAEGVDRPRVWWCVTGTLSFLPIHAASITQDGSLESANDYMVSSYTPTLSALIKSRSGWRPVPRNQATGILAACRNAMQLQQAPLNDVEHEIEVVSSSFERASAQVLLSSSPNTTSQLLKQALAGGCAHILHLACHGLQEENPLESAFFLSDGRLSVKDLITMHLPDAVLAFLSACQTARGSERLPDQAVHLAASMLFCGFRSVVGTMWMMHDADGPDVARSFYERLFESEELDLDGIAYALDEAVTQLRKKGVPASRWSLFIHIGG